MGQCPASIAVATGLPSGGAYLPGGTVAKPLAARRRAEHAHYRRGNGHCCGRMDFGKLSPSRGISWGPTRRTSLWWVALFLVLTALVSISTPPLRSPDEIDHIRRAYLLTRGTLVLKTGTVDVEKNTVNASGGEIDTGLDAFLMYHLGHIGKPDTADIHIRDSEYNALRWTRQTAFRPAPGTSYYLPLLYAPQATALLLGERMHLTIQDSYQLARAFSSLACFALLVLAFILYPVNLGVLALISLPMSLFQMASASLDGVSNAVAIVCIAVFMRLYSSRVRNSVGPFSIWCLGLWALLSCRPHLLPMVGLPFMVYLQSRQRSQLVVGIVTLVAVLTWFWIAVSATSDPRAQLGQSASALVRQYVNHPSEFFVVLWQTLSSAENIKFYWQSFIGILGWLELPLPGWTYSVITAAGVLLLAAGIRTTSTTEIWNAGWCLTVVAITATLLVFFALLVTWTPHPASVVRGVQGRYFFVPCILMAYAWQAPLFHMRVWQLRICSAGLLAFIAFNAIILITTLQQRYPLTWATAMLRMSN